MVTNKTNKLLRKLQQLLILLIFIGFPFHGFQFFSVGTLGVTPSDFFIILVVIYTILSISLTKAKISIVDHSLPKIIILFALACFFSIIKPLFNSSDGHIFQFFKTYTHLLYLMVFGFLAFVVEIDNKSLLRIFKWLLVISILVNIYSFYQLIARVYDLPFAWVKLNNQALADRGTGSLDNYRQLALKYKNFYRATSIFSEPSALASWNLFMLSILFPLISDKSKGLFRNRSYIIFQIVLTLLTLLITFSLTAFLGIVTIFTFLFIIANSKEKIKYLKITLFGLTILALVDIMLSQLLGVSVFLLLFERIYLIVTSLMSDEILLVTGDSFFFRAERMIEGFKTYIEYPFSGIGMGLFSEYNTDIEFPDNSISQVVAETGFLGMVFFILIFSSSIYTVFYLLKKHKKNPFLSELDLVLLKIAGLINVYQFFLNFASANIFVTIGMWIPFFISFSIISKLLIKSGKDRLNIVIYKESIMEKFSKRFKTYLKSN